MEVFYIEESQLYKKISRKQNRVPVLVFIVWALILIAISGVCYAMLQALPVKFTKKSTISYPITNGNVQITSFNNTWTKSDQSREGVVTSSYLPEVELTFGADTTQSIICFFENAEGEIIGDSVSLTVENGTVNGEKTHKFTGTKGFSEEAVFNSYVYSTDNFWNIVVQSVDSENQINLITKIPLPPNL